MTTADTVPSLAMQHLLAELAEKDATIARMRDYVTDLVAECDSLRESLRATLSLLQDSRRTERKATWQAKAATRELDRYTSQTVNP